MFFDDNFKILETRFPELAKDLSLVNPVSGFITNKDEIYDINVSGIWRYGGQFTTDWEKVIEPINGPYPKLVVVYGVGLGNHLMKLFENPNIKKSVHILIVEKDISLLKKSLELRKWDHILSDPRVTLLAGQKIEDTYKFFLEYFRQYTRIYLIKTLTVIIEPELDKQTGNYYLAIAEELKKSVDDANSMYMGSEEDTYRGYMNILKNIPKFDSAIPFDYYAGKFKDKIGIAVSTGPSLKYSLDWLREVQDKAVIVSSDSALKVLLDAGIEPHFVGCLERVPETNLLFDHLPEKLRTSLIGCPVLWPETIDKYPGPLVNMIRPIGQLCWFFDDQKYYFTGNSVSHLLYIALNALGCREVLIVGQDLAFDRYSERTHVEGVPKIIYEVGQKQRFNRKVKTPMEEVSEVEANDGGRIQTMEWYIQFRNQLEMLVKEQGYNGYNVIPKNYGAKIGGLKLMEPQDVLKSFDFGSNNMWSTMEELANGYKIKNIEVYQFEMSQKMAQAEKNLRIIHETSLSVLDALSLFRQRYNPNYYDEDTYTPFLKKIEFIANEMMDGDNHFYDHFFHAQVMTRSSQLQQLQGQILAGRIPESQKIEAQFTLSFNWFDLIQKWSGRMEHFIKSIRNDLWKNTPSHQNMSSSP
ncbi:MAG: hypothetical protein ACD_73C00088G0005 [uncultured bacterium]|nr:MAG: hypothetical protein ACD_73C00088G0005 [uncultured bacterium]